MAITKPYFRITRDYWEPYILDKRYSNDRLVLCRAFHIIEKDLKTVFEYIEPDDENLKVFSHRNYELLLRACTEIETNSKRILEANGYGKGKNLDITDYYKINKVTKLSDFEVAIHVWSPERKILKPFENWANDHQLSWYKAYNKAKHDRHINFQKANLENTMLAIAGLLIILYSQFGVNVFCPYQDAFMSNTDDDGFVYVDGSTFFSIKEPKWLEAEKYTFDWNTLKIQVEPFQQCTF